MSKHITQSNIKLSLPSSVMRMAKIFRDAGAEFRAVGGCLRDLLLNKNPKDIDLATNLTPNEIIKLLKIYDIKALPTGIKYGTVTALVSNEHFEITTLRQDLTTNGRHAQVEYTNDFAIDAMRRDFTINAMSYCPLTHTLFDYFEGRSDLKQQKVRFIGNAKERISEDYLRILRFFRFSTYYATDVDTEGLEACTEMADKLQNISAERIKYELDRILASDNCYNIFIIMHQQNILQQILPYSLNLIMLKTIITASQTLSVPYTIMLGYAALLYKHDTELLTTELKAKKFSNNEQKTIIYLINALNNLQANNTSIEQLWYEKPEMLSQYFIIASAVDYASTSTINMMQNKFSATPPTFPVSSISLIKMGINGAKLGKVIATLKQRWIDSKFTLTSNELIKYAQQLQK